MNPVTTVLHDAMALATYAEIMANGSHEEGDHGTAMALGMLADQVRDVVITAGLGVMGSEELSRVGLQADAVAIERVAKGLDLG